METLKLSNTARKEGGTRSRTTPNGGTSNLVIIDDYQAPPSGRPLGANVLSREAERPFTPSYTRSNRKEGDHPHAHYGRDDFRRPPNREPYIAREAHPRVRRSPSPPPRRNNRPHRYLDLNDSESSDSDTEQLYQS